MLLSVASYEREKHVFYKKNFKIEKNDTFNNDFCGKIFSYYRFLPIIKTILDFHKLWLIFFGKKLYCF